MVALDFISCYAADFGIPFANLHGENDYKYGEIGSRRVLVQEAVKDMVTKGLVTVEVNRGYLFTVSGKGLECAEKMESIYAKRYREIARAAVTKYGNVSDEDVLETIQERAVYALREKTMFYIKRISLLTGENTISSVDLTPGLNIIYGESETGKSLVLDCIDYMFGAKEHRFSTKLDIKEITLILDVDGKSLTMRREIDSNDVEVSGQVEYIENGTYKIGKAKHWINDVWLHLFGIEKEVEILMTLAGRPQHLTLRTFYHLLLIVPFPLS